ncbi:uncharacterized protein perm1a [Mustelus asterias]
MLQNRDRPTLGGPFPPFPHEDGRVLHTSEDVLSASEEDLELEIVNQFLMAASPVMSGGHMSSSQQCFLISDEELPSSRSQQCLLISNPESSHSAPQCNSIARSPVSQDGTDFAPSTLDSESYAENLFDDDYYENCTEVGTGGHLDVGFGYTQDIGTRRKDPQALPELREGAQVQDQNDQARQTVDHGSKQSQSTFEEDTNTQTYVTLSKDSQFPINTKYSTHLELSVAEGQRDVDDSMTVPESYEYFYEDFGEDEEGLFFLRVPSVFKRVKRGSREPGKINLLTVIKSLVRKYLHPTKQGQTAVVSARDLNTPESTKVDSSSDLGSLNNALMKYTEGDGSQTVMESVILTGGGHSCLSCTPKDLCLFCFACASWAMKSATSQSDMWKAALLVNIGAISAVRYFRTKTKRENSKYLALQDS